MKKIIILLSISVIYTISYGQDIMKVQLGIASKNNEPTVYVNITNTTTESVDLYDNGFITDEGIISRAGVSYMTFTGYNAQNAVLESSEKRPLSKPGNSSVKILTISPGKRYTIEVPLYNSTGKYGLFEKTIYTLSSIVVNIQLLYKTDSMSDYDEIHITSAPLILK